MQLHWESLGVIAALAGVIGAILAQVWKGGAAEQRMKHFEELQIAHGKRLDDHHADINATKVRFAEVNGKLDQLIHQQESIIEKIDTLADRKDH